MRYSNGNKLLHSSVELQLAEIARVEEHDVVPVPLVDPDRVVANVPCEHLPARLSLRLLEITQGAAIIARAQK